MKKITVREALVAAIDAAWQWGEPLSQHINARTRYAPRIVARDFGLRADDAAAELEILIDDGVVEDVVVDRKMKKRGLRACGSLRRSREARSQVIDSLSAEVHAEVLRKCEGPTSKSLKALAEVGCGGPPRRLTASSGAARRRRRRAPTARLNGNEISGAVHIRLGDVVIDRSQSFRCIAIEPYVRRDGKQTEIAVWESACAECGAPFRFANPVTRWRSPNRRCDLHKAPLRRTRFTRRSKL